MNAALKRLHKTYLNLISDPSVPEEKLHRFFIKYPIFLPLWKPYDNVVFTKLKLGSQHIVDFAFAREDSPGFSWNFIEIEKPVMKPVTKKGDPSKELSHGVRQLHDWDEWFSNNRSHVAQYFPFQKEVGIIGLAKPKMQLVIGRREFSRTPIISSLSNHSFDIMSFDRLMDNVTSPYIDYFKPIKVCSFVNGKMKTISELHLDLSFSIRKRV